MKFHDNHEDQHPIEALQDIVRNKYIPAVALHLRKIEKEVNPYQVLRLIDEIQYAGHLAKETIYKRFPREDKS